MSDPKTEAIDFFGGNLFHVALYVLAGVPLTVFSFGSGMWREVGHVMLGVVWLEMVWALLRMLRRNYNAQ